MGVTKVEIDYTKIKAAINAAGLTNEKLSYEIGRNGAFVSRLNKTPWVLDSVERLLCERLGIEPGSLIKQEEPAEPGDNIAVFVKKLESIENRIKRLADAFTGQDDIKEIRKKVNANTLQLEKIKDSVSNLHESEYDRAEQFLKDMLRQGERSANDILETAAEKGIKQGKLMEAKKKLGVDIYTKGYGSGKRPYWKLGK